MLLARRKTSWWEGLYCPVHPKNAYRLVLVPVEVNWRDYWLHSICSVTAVPAWKNPSIPSRFETLLLLFPSNSSPHCYISFLLWTSHPDFPASPQPAVNDTGISSSLIALFHFLRAGSITSKLFPLTQGLALACWPSPAVPESSEEGSTWGQGCRVQPGHALRIPVRLLQGFVESAHVLHVLLVPRPLCARGDNPAENRPVLNTNSQAAISDPAKSPN